jgi:site-specific DNA-methyltransferase (adenine-specific)/modification methylase
MTDPVHIGDATLYLGDCLDILPTLGPVDAVVTDPPYNYGKDYGTHDDSMPDLEFWTWLESRMRAVPVRDGGVVYFTCSTQMMARCEAWDFFRFRQWLVWHRPNLVNVHAHADWKQTWEPIYYGGRGKFKAIAGVFPDSAVFTVPTPQSNFTEGREHICQRPVALLTGILKRADAEKILDPFMGSGTTGVACARLGRKFIGIEIEPRYFEIACKRIKREYDQLALFPHEPKREAVQMELEDKHDRP